jgi:hypothetical protein
VALLASDCYVHVGGRAAVGPNASCVSVPPLIELMASAVLASGGAEMLPADNARPPVDRGRQIGAPDDECTGALSGLTPLGRAIAGRRPDKGRPAVRYLLSAPIGVSLLAPIDKGTAGGGGDGQVVVGWWCRSLAAVATVRLCAGRPALVNFSRAPPTGRRRRPARDANADRRGPFLGARHDASRAALIRVGNSFRSRAKSRVIQSPARSLLLGGWRRRRHEDHSRRHWATARAPQIHATWA